MATRPVYSNSFWQSAGHTGDTPLLVPSGQLWVLREFDVYYNPSSFVPNAVRIEGDYGQTMVWTQFVIATGERTFQWQGRLVIAVGCSIHSDEATDVSLSGYVLTLP
jgi:hypothetical protein